VVTAPQHEASSDPGYDPMRQFSELAGDVRFSSEVYATSMGPVMGRTILQMDPPEHMRYRALVAKAFRARVVDQWSDAIIGATVGELIDAFAADGHADLVRQLTPPGTAIPMPSTSSAAPISTSRSATDLTPAWACTWRGWRPKFC
jgi:hypothetical protein